MVHESFIREQLRHDRSLRAVEMARRIRDRFALTVHPRSIERALERTEKKLPEGGGRRKEELGPLCYRFFGRLL